MGPKTQVHPGHYNRKVACVLASVTNATAIVLTLIVSFGRLTGDARELSNLPSPLNTYSNTVITI